MPDEWINQVYVQVFECKQLLLKYLNMFERVVINEATEPSY